MTAVREPAATRATSLAPSAAPPEPRTFAPTPLATPPRRPVRPLPTGATPAAWSPTVLHGPRPTPRPAPVVTPAPAPAARPAPVRRRLRGLDGLRAIAVMAVVLFHLDYALLPGGFLGVDVFFVISGFLITNLLAREILATGGVALRAFYLRRARRLLPSVVALLGAVVVAGTVLWPDQSATLTGGVTSSLAYVTNWWLIADDEPYFVASGRPSMLQHLWSLAIEEQYYILWSLAVLALAGVLVAGRDRLEIAARMRRVVVAAALLAVGSTALMAWLADRHDLPYGGSTSRVYFGTDTHTMGLFLGSAAGAWMALRQVRQPPAPAVGGRRPRARWVGVTDVVCVLAVVLLVRSFVTVDEFVPGLYRGGFLLFDAVALIAVLCAVRAGSIAARVLDMRPVQWLGRRSYSIYLWHWPVCVVTRPDLDVHGPTLIVNALRLVLVLGLAALTYRFVEVPLRFGGPSALRASLSPADRPPTGRPAVTAAVVASAALILAAMAVPASRGAAPVAAPASPPVTAPVTAPVTGSLTAPVPTSPHRRTPGPHRSSGSPSHPAPAPTSGAAASGCRTVDGAPRLPSLSAYGDSVLLGAAPSLRRFVNRLDLDAVEGRAAMDVLDDVAEAARSKPSRPYVLIHTGDNGIISPDQMRRTVRSLSGARQVLLVTVRVDRPWEARNNELIRAVAGERHNVSLVDWNRVSAGHRDWFYDDGVHLTPAGTEAYLRAVRAAVRCAGA